MIVQAQKGAGSFRAAGDQAIDRLLLGRRRSFYAFNASVTACLIVVYPSPINCFRSWDA